MNSFLHHIAQSYYQEWGNNMSKLAFVFPNRRAGLFFQKYLGELTKVPVWSPHILTINDFFTQLTDLKAEDPLGLLFDLYQVYQEESGKEESFDEFYYWGEMLLNDFDDIDKYMVDAQLMFQDLSDQKEIEDQFSFMAPEQVDAIKMFWEHFRGEKTVKKQEFSALWDRLASIYSRFRKKLLDRGVGYEGMLFRRVVEAIEKEGVLPESYERVVFVGFNALTKSEELLFSYFLKKQKGDYYWDFETDMIRHPRNKSWFLAKDFVDRYPSRYSKERQKGLKAPVIYLHGVPGDVGQTRLAYNLLKEMNLLQEQEATRTAVVLADEQLLTPTLHAIPENMPGINVTMGYPLKQTPVYSLLVYLIDLQRHVQSKGGKTTFYFRDVLPLLQHQYLHLIAKEKTTELVRQIHKENRIYLEPSDLHVNDLLEKVFVPVVKVENFSAYFLDILKSIFVQAGPAEEVLDEEASLEQENIYYLHTVIQRLSDILKEHQVAVQPETYFRMLLKIAEGISIPFRGEPLRGLQVMGVLETRCLDFDNLIILSMNEGVFPKKGAAASFIPYNLRTGFGLPTMEHQDSIFAYYFYRLIQRGGVIHLVYNTRSDGMQTGEVSRFIHQLRYHFHVPVVTQVQTGEVAFDLPQDLEVRKEGVIRDQLETFLDEGKREMSASGLNTYMECSLRFYFQYVARLEEPEEATEEIDAPTFGNLFHQTMEFLFEPFEGGKEVAKEDLQGLIKEEGHVESLIVRAFAKNVYRQENGQALKWSDLKGRNLLVAEILKKYVRQLLKTETSLAPFHYLKSEQLFHCKIPFQIGETKRAVKLKGFIDRMDKVNGTVRILDYKTGDGKPVFENVEDLFDRELPKRPKAVFQTFLYALLYLENQGGENPVAPGIIYLRTIFDRKYDCHVQEKGKGPLVDYRPYDKEFRRLLTELLTELFNPEVPFTQTQDPHTCSYCPYAHICHR